MNRQSVGIIILAAGGSTRMGQPKQLLRFSGKTLLRHAIEAAAGTKAAGTVVVLGSHADTVAKETAEYAVEIVVNKAWKEGMASSIRCGLNSVLAEWPQTDAVLIMLCDQPLVTAEFLSSLIETADETGKSIVASFYNDSPGVPALFRKDMFAQLLQLYGDKGAKAIILRNIGQTEVLPFPPGSVDLDLPKDYSDLLNRENKDTK